MATIKFVVDGKPVSVNADPAMPLLYALRDDLKLKNPHFGCGLAQCGAWSLLRHAAVRGSGQEGDHDRRSRHTGCRADRFARLSLRLSLWLRSRPLRSLSTVVRYRTDRQHGSNPGHFPSP